MQLTTSQKYNLSQFLWIIICSTIIGFVYVLIEDGWQLFPLVNGTLAAFFIGALVALLELFMFAGLLRKIPFINLFFLRVSLYFVLAVAITLNLFIFSRTIKYDISYGEALYSEEFQHYLYNQYHIVLVFSFIAIILAVFTIQMTKKIGFNDLIDFITGKYITPRKEMRVFMFLGLGGYETIIKMVGNMEFHNFMNDFLSDISNTIRVRKGRIVHYREDEVVIVWTMKSGFENANCVRTYFDICHEIVRQFEYYHATYGLLPKPKCAIHAGDVIKAEIGEIKSEISFFGDVVNSTSRILYEGIMRGIDIMITQPVLESIQLPIHYWAKDQGQFVPRGKHKPVQLYSLHLQYD